nr:unnamed protein product [Digitaria exilis]
MKVYTLSCFLLGTLALALAGRPDAAVQELDRVLSLPGQPSYSPALRQYSGYVTTDEYLGKALFYWFLEAMDKPDEKPLELGPFLVKKDVPELEVNPYAWNQGNFGNQIGNPYMDGDTDLWGIVDSAWHHAIISDNLYSDFQKNCNFSLVDLSPECIADLVQYNALNEIIDIYSLYTDRCELGYPDSNTSFSVQIGRTSNGRLNLMKMPMGYDPCTQTYATEYFNRKDVQKALHADHGGASHPFSLCRRKNPHHVNPVYAEEAWPANQGGLVAVVGGWTVVYDGLTFVTVRGAGHMVPLTKPEQALELFKHFLANTNLPSKPF